MFLLASPFFTVLVSFDVRFFTVLVQSDGLFFSVLVRYRVTSSSLFVCLSTIKIEHLGSITFLNMSKLISARSEFTSFWSNFARLRVTGPLYTCVGVSNARFGVSGLALVS